LVFSFIEYMLQPEYKLPQGKDCCVLYHNCILTAWKNL